jgi:hypothetical protein
MEVNSSVRRIEKFSGRPSTISLKEFKVAFSTVVYELELKYGINYIEAFAFKQLAHYVHYEALDVYEQHSPWILGFVLSALLMNSEKISKTYLIMLSLTTTELQGIIPKLMAL